MNSRQRILAAIDHTEPDHLPVDLGSTPSSGISAIAYDNLLRYLNLEDKRIWIYDVVQQVAQPSMEILNRFRIDVVDVGRTFNTHDRDWHDCRLSNGHIAQLPAWFKPEKQNDGSFIAYSGNEPIAVLPAGFIAYDQTIHPFLNGYPPDYGKQMDQAMARIHWAAFSHSPWDHAREEDFWEQLRVRAQMLRRQNDRAIMISAGCNLFEWGTFLRRLDNFLADLVSDPGEVERFLDALMTRHLNTLANICTAVGDVVDIIRLGDDLGMNNGPFMSPRTYRRLFKPRHTQLCSLIKSHSNMHILLHSCGSIYKLIPDLIEAGFEILNPVQTNAQDMQPEKLKREFGSVITFWGAGADTRAVLNFASPGEVRDHVRRNIEVLLPGGGFVFTPIHNILPDVPPQNIIAMFEAVDEYR